MVDSVTIPPIPIALNPATQPVLGQKDTQKPAETRSASENTARVDPATAQRQAQLSQPVALENSAQKAPDNSTANQQEPVISRPLNQPLFITQEAQGQETVPSNPNALAGISVHAQALRPQETTIGQESDRNASAFLEARQRFDQQDADVTAQEQSQQTVNPEVPNFAPGEGQEPLPPAFRVENAAESRVNNGAASDVLIEDRQERQTVVETLRDQASPFGTTGNDPLAEIAQDPNAGIAGAFGLTGGDPFTFSNSDDFGTGPLDDAEAILRSVAVAQGQPLAETQQLSNGALTPAGAVPNVPTGDAATGFDAAIFSPLLVAQPGFSNAVGNNGRGLTQDAQQGNSQLAGVNGSDTPNLVGAGLEAFVGTSTERAPTAALAAGPGPGGGLGSSAARPQDIGASYRENLVPAADPQESFTPQPIGEDGFGLPVPGLGQSLPNSQDFQDSADPLEGPLPEPFQGPGAVPNLAPEINAVLTPSAPDLPPFEALNAGTEPANAPYRPRDNREDFAPEPERFAPPPTDQGRALTQQPADNLDDLAFNTTDIPENIHTIGDPSFQGGPEIALQRANNPVETFSDNDDEGRLAYTIAGAVTTSTGIAGNTPFDVTASDPEEVIKIEALTEYSLERQIEGRDPGPVPPVGNAPEYEPEADPEEAFNAPARRENNRSTVEANPEILEQPRTEDNARQLATEPNPTLATPERSIDSNNPQPTPPAFPGDRPETVSGPQAPVREGLGQEADAAFRPSEPSELPGAVVTADNAIGIAQRSAEDQPQAITPVATSGDRTDAPAIGNALFENEAQPEPNFNSLALNTNDAPGRDLSEAEQLAQGPTTGLAERSLETLSDPNQNPEQEALGAVPNSVAPPAIDEQPVIREEVGRQLTEQELLEQAIREARDVTAAQTGAGNPLVPEVGYDSEIRVLDEEGLNNQLQTPQSYQDPGSQAGGAPSIVQGAAETLRATTFTGLGNPS